ncbi:hypothetical protein DRF57_22220 [Chryseobacterium rhizosphaerae]|uniref:HNH endonuclease n=2 Tax=Chryseobacterium rhizosphaerae TaxID=395937 RepID=A0ABX9IE71_9FLAO|nr:hypothetical protein DRF57_22220 [Chryseobacterium rhizosphaerae]
MEPKKVNRSSLPADPMEFAEFIGGGINSVRAAVSNSVARTINVLTNDAVRNKYEVGDDGALTLMTGVPKESFKEKAVNGAFDLATIALAAVGGPEGVLTSRGTKSTAIKAIDEVKAEAKAISKAAVEKNGTLNTGPFAGEGYPAVNGHSRKFTATERKAIKEQGYTLGCHTCGQKNPGTKSGNFILDHQPANALVPNGWPQTFFPHCKYCSASQGGIISGMKRQGILPKISK